MIYNTNRDFGLKTFRGELNFVKKVKNTTVYGNLQEKLKGKSNQVILNVTRDEVKTSELLENIDSVAKAIDMLNIEKNQTITVVDDTTEPFINLFYGSNKFGSIFSTLGFPLFSDNPEEFTENIGSEALFISKRFYEAMENNLKTRGKIANLGLKSIIILPTSLLSTKNMNHNESIDELLGKGINLYKNIEYIDYTVLMRDSEKDNRVITPNVSNGKNDFAYLSTSGSTGKPKILRMPNSSFLSMCEKVEANGYDFVPGEDVYLATLPCNFVTPLETLNFFLQLGVPAYIEPLRDFSKIAEIYYRSKATVIMCPPSLLDPLYIMVTKSKKAKLNFIIETLKNAPKDKKLTSQEKIDQLKLMKKMFEKRPNVKYVFSAGEPLTDKLENVYKNDNIEILNCTGSGETGPTAINGFSLKGDSYRVLDPITFEVIYSSDEPPLDVPIRGLVENKKSSSAFNGYLGNDDLTESCYAIDEDGNEFWKYFDMVEVRNGKMRTLCRAIDSIIKSDKIITPIDLTKVILEDARVLKCEAYPITLNEEDRMVVDIVIRERDRIAFNEIIDNAHTNIGNKLGAEYLPFGYKDNQNFGSNPYTAKLDRDAIRKNVDGYINPLTKQEFRATKNYESVNKRLRLY